MFSSSTKISLLKSISLSGTISFVAMLPPEEVPAILLVIFIFLGSELLSVKKSKLSIILIPVIILSQLKFKSLGFTKTK
ncbi:hypothetical protein [uncultured Mediterranean phage]|nr:hypothetical protein [uncultured Mediterranean phage]